MSEPLAVPVTAKPTAVAVDSSRAEMTALIAKSLRQPNMDPDWYARIAAAGLTESGDYKLSAVWKLTFDRIVSAADAYRDLPSIGASMCEEILAAAIRDPALKPAAMMRCEPFEVLEKQLEVSRTPAARLEAMIKACKIEGVRPSDKLTAFGALAAALVEDELAAQPESTPEEKGFARRIRALCTMAS